MAKTYVDGAVVITAKAQKYLTRWQPKLVQGKTTEQITALADLIACIATFLSKWHKSTPVN